MQFTLVGATDRVALIYASRALSKIRRDMKADKHSHHHSCLATALCIENISGNHNHFTPLGKQSQGQERQTLIQRGPFGVNDVKRTNSCWEVKLRN